MTESQNNNEIKTLRRLKKGEHQAFDEIYHLYSRRIYRFAYSFLKNKQDSEEIIQEVFLRVWKNRQNIDECYSFRSFLFTICYNIIIDKLRERVKERNYREFLKEQAIQFDNDTDKQVAFSELNKSYRKAIELLPDRRKTIYLMHRFKGLSYREIAEKLNISIKTVENQMVQAHKFLRKSLEMKHL
jgi:RNA polymerase sigma-70 factor (ECF subfamily)